MTVAASVRGRVWSRGVATGDVLSVSVSNFPVEFRFACFVHHGVDRQRMRQRPFRAQQSVAVGRAVGLVPQSIARRVDVADVVLAGSGIRQVVTNLGPEIALSPADDDRRTKKETQFRIGLIVGPWSQENGNQTSARSTQEISQGRSYFGTGPFRLDKGLRNDQNDPATGSQSQSQWITSWIATVTAVSTPNKVTVESVCDILHFTR